MRLEVCERGSDADEPAAERCELAEQAGLTRADGRTRT
jgi:hypothetical protein